MDDEMDKYAKQADEVQYQDDDAVINEEEIEEARVVIAKMHPMIKTPYQKVLPTFGWIFKCCFCCCGGNRSERMEKFKDALLKEQKEHKEKIDKVFADFNVQWEAEGIEDHNPEKKSKVEETDDNYDPYNQLGYGFSAYFNTLKTFSWVFLLMTLIMLPAFIFYAQDGGLKEVSRGYYNSVFMMGNFGFNKAVCVSNYINLNSQPAQISCDVGQISDLTYAGIIPNNLTAKWDNVAYGYCGAWNNTNIGEERRDQAPPGVDSCTDHWLELETLTSDFNTACGGLQMNACSFQPKWYIKNLTAAQELEADTVAEYKSCSINTARVYMQYNCQQTVEHLNQKRSKGLLVSTCACVACLVFLTIIYYLKKTATLDLVQWDVSTLTASDFTVEMTITESIWALFKENLSSHVDNLPVGGAAPNHTKKKGLPVVTFEAFLEKHICEFLSKKPKVNKDEAQIRVAQVTFGFDNPKLLSELNSRGALITKGKLEKLPEQNEKIDTLIKEKKADMVRPVAAFITFETQEGKNRALKYIISEKDRQALEKEHTKMEGQEAQDMQTRISQSNFKLVGEDIGCTQAPEPSEIIWHNRHVTSGQQCKNKVLVFIACLVFLLGMFALFSWMKSKATKNMWRYPSTLDCDTIDSLFVDENDSTSTNVKQYQFWANIDQDLTLERNGAGIYMCYCNTYRDEPSYWNDPSDEYTDIKTGYKKKGELCYNKVFQSISGLAVAESITGIITIVNTIIAMLCKFMITRIGYHTVTGEITAITMSIFIATFFNTAILLLLAQADLQEVTILSWLPLNGSFPDLTEKWYIVVAPSLILTMVINAFYPYVDLGISFGTLALYRCMDQGFSTYLCCKKEKTTKCKTIQAYVNIYAGPEHAMSYRYSAILVCTWITFMYGIALPIMFVIGAITMFNYYIVDRLLLAYYYRRPPIYDDKLNHYALVTLKYAPVLMLFFGYWTIGSMQVFDDELIPLSNSAKPLSTGHSIWPSGNQALPLFICGVIVLILFVMIDCCSPCLKKMHLLPEEETELIEEDVGTYFQCVSINERKRWYAQEIYANNKLGIHTMGDWAAEKIRTEQGDYRVIKNAPNYEILSNIRYCQNFQFTPIDMVDTQEEQDISDMIMRCLYLGYQSNEQLKNLDFKRILAKRSHKHAQFAKDKGAKFLANHPNLLKKTDEENQA